MARKNNTLIYAAIGVGAYLLLTRNKNQPPATPQCPPGYFWNGSTCQKLPTGINPNTGGNAGGGFFNSSFWQSMPNILDSVGNMINTVQSNNNNQVGYIYQMRY